jgi:opacity protein-like surface antigen
MRVSKVVFAAVIGLVALPVAAQAADWNGVDIPDVNDIDINRWDRAFVGLVAGGAMAGAYESGTYNDAIDSFVGGSIGLAAGLDMTLDNGVVVGAVADAAWLGLPARVDGVDGDVYRLNWAGSLRGRVGLDFGNLLPYLTGGLAVAGGEVSAVDLSSYEDGVWFGVTAGAGVEMAVGDAMSLDFGYRYTWYGEQDLTFTSPAPGVSHVGFDSHQLTVGLNWAL